MKGVDGLLCVLTEKIDAELLDAAGMRKHSNSQNLFTIFLHYSDKRECFFMIVCADQDKISHHFKVIKQLQMVFKVLHLPFCVQSP